MSKKVVCPHCGADLKVIQKPPPFGPSIGRRSTMAEIEREKWRAKRAEPPVKAGKPRAKAKRNATIQFEG